MKKIYIREEKLGILENENKEVTFYEFFINAKSFLKDLLDKPAYAKPSELFASNNISKNDLISKMKDLGIIKCDEKVTEVPVDEIKTHPFGKKMRAKYTVKYKIPRSHFNDKMRELYNELFENSNSSMVTEDGEAGIGGASSCGSVMQGGGSNPDAGQYVTPMSPIQRRKFWNPSLTRSKDEKNGSISINNN